MCFLFWPFAVAMLIYFWVGYCFFFLALTFYCISSNEIEIASRVLHIGESIGETHIINLPHLSTYSLSNRNFHIITKHEKSNNFTIIVLLLFGSMTPTKNCEKWCFFLPSCFSGGKLLFHKSPSQAR